MYRWHPCTLLQATQEQKDAVSLVFRTVRSKTMGLWQSGCVGISGSVRGGSLAKIFNSLRVSNHFVVVFGCGNGDTLLSAQAMGARGAIGYELPDNASNRIIFEAVAKELPNSSASEWIAQDIMNLDLPLQFRDRMTCVYSFWVGMPPHVQDRILDLCSTRFPNVGSIAVFLDRNWPDPQTGVMMLQSMDHGI